MLAEPVTERQMAPLPFAAGAAQVHVERPVAVEVSARELVVGRGGVEQRAIAERLERGDVRSPRLERSEGDLDVDRRLGVEARDRRRPDVIDPHDREPPLWFQKEIPISLSLLVVAGVILASIGLSVIAAWREKKPGSGKAGGAPSVKSPSARENAAREMPDRKTGS